MKITAQFADADHQDLAELCGHYLIVLVLLMMAYIGGWGVYLNGHFGDEFVWLKWSRMTYTIVTFTGYFVLSLIAIWYNRFHDQSFSSINSDDDENKAL